MTHISCTRPGTAEPWSVPAVFSELFYQHRAAGFSEGREQHTTTLPRSLWSVSASADLQGSLALSHSTTQQLQPLHFWLETCCCCPTGVLGPSNGKTRLQTRPAVQEHQLNTKVCREMEEMQHWEFPLSPKFLICFVTKMSHLKLSHSYLFCHPLPCPQNSWVFLPVILPAQFLGIVCHGL